MSDFNFTDLELVIVNGFHDGRCSFSFFDEGVVQGSGIWAEVLAGEAGDSKKFRGVISSLIKKGFFASYRSEDGSWLELTDDAITYIHFADAARANRAAATYTKGDRVFYENRGLRQAGVVLSITKNGLRVKNEETGRIVARQSHQLSK